MKLFDEFKKLIIFNQSRIQFKLMSFRELSLFLLVSIYQSIYRINSQKLNYSSCSNCILSELINNTYTTHRWTNNTCLTSPLNSSMMNDSAYLNSMSWGKNILACSNDSDIKLFQNQNCGSNNIFFDSVIHINFNPKSFQVSPFCSWKISLKKDEFSYYLNLTDLSNLDYKAFNHIPDFQNLVNNLNNYTSGKFYINDGDILIFNPSTSNPEKNITFTISIGKTPKETNFKGFFIFIGSAIAIIILIIIVIAIICSCLSKSKRLRESLKNTPYQEIL